MIASAASTRPPLLLTYRGSSPQRRSLLLFFSPPLVEVDEGDFTLAHYTRMANYLDLCAIALPCGFGRSGLPIGLQLIGRAGAERDLIAAAWAIERLLDVVPRVPPLHVSHCAD